LTTFSPRMSEIVSAASTEVPVSKEVVVSAQAADDDDEGNLYNLFVCEDYIEKSWMFGDLVQPLLCSNMSSTEYDLTGQIVWPACVLLSWFIYQNRDLFKDQIVLELGAGCGLGGFVAAHYAKKCIITDGNDIVCSLLDQNKAHLQTEHVQVAKLLWGLQEEIVNTVGDDLSQSPDVIIGADVILWPNQIHALLTTIRWLLARKRNQAVCYISYIVRAHTTTQRLFATAERLGLSIEERPIESFVPEDVHDFDVLEKKLLCIRIKAEVTEEQLLVDVTDELTSQMDTLSRPC